MVGSIIKTETCNNMGQQLFPEEGGHKCLSRFLMLSMLWFLGIDWGHRCGSLSFDAYRWVLDIGPLPPGVWPPLVRLLPDSPFPPSLAPPPPPPYPSVPSPAG